MNLKIYQLQNNLLFNKMVTKINKKKVCYIILSTISFKAKNYSVCIFRKFKKSIGLVKKYYFNKKHFVHKKTFSYFCFSN